MSFQVILFSKFYENKALSPQNSRNPEFADVEPFLTSGAILCDFRFRGRRFWLRCRVTRRSCCFRRAVFFSGVIDDLLSRSCVSRAPSVTQCLSSFYTKGKTKQWLIFSSRLFLDCKEQVKQENWMLSCKLLVFLAMRETRKTFFFYSLLCEYKQNDHFGRVEIYSHHRAH